MRNDTFWEIMSWLSLTIVFLICLISAWYSDVLWPFLKIIGGIVGFSFVLALITRWIRFCEEQKKRRKK